MARAAVARGVRGGHRRLEARRGVPPCPDGDIDFARDSEIFELSVQVSGGGVVGALSFADQDDRDIGRPAALLSGHRPLASTDWIAYDESWPVPAGLAEIRVAIRSWITHWDDFGGIDQLVVSYAPAR